MDLGIHYSFTLVLDISFRENTLELVNQVIDITISTASRIKDHYLLSRDRQRYLNDFRLMISRGGTRLRRHLGCMRIMRYYISTVTELTTDTDDDLKLFIEYLSTSEKFVQLRGEQGNILEYVTRSLIDDQKKFRLFKLAKCDRSYIFSNELSIKIDPSSRAIEVDSRNVWERDAWFWDVMRMFNLKIVVRRSLEASFNEWISKIQERFEIMILCSMWALKSYSEEDMIREDPMFMLQQYYHCCDLAIIMLRLSEGALTIYTRAVWNCFSRVIAGWIEQLNMIISHDLLPDTSDYVLSILNFHVQCVVGCPDPSLIERTLLITALQKLGETLEKVNDNEHSRLARFYTGRCITMLLDKSYLRQDEDKTGLMFLSVIGNGTTGIVYKCFDPTINMTIALKEVHYSGSDDGLVNEIKYLRFLHHRNVVSLHDALVTNDKFFIKMELCLGGTLLNLINSKRPVDDELFRKVAVEICLGLAYLHMNHIVHGDLKPSNILISQFGAIKLADFGTAHRAATTTRSKGALQLGTIQYMSPETILNGRVGLEADLWSLGCTLFHFATGCVPYAECDSPWQVLKKMSDKQLFDITPLRSAKLDPQAIAIIESCLDFDVTKRPVMTQLCLLDYFYDIHSSTN